MTTTAAAVPGELSIILGVIVWIPLTVWVMSLIHWMITADIDVPSGLLGIFTGLALAYFTLKPPIPMLSPVFFGVTWLTVLLYPAIKSSLDKRALVAIDLESLDKAYSGLALKPDNVGLKLKVARLVYSRGLLGHAIVLAEDALKGMPEQLFQDEMKMIAGWKQAAGNPTKIRSLPCLECTYPNAPGRLHCERCGAPFLLHHARGKWLGPNLAKRVVSGWFAGMAMFIGIPMAISFLQTWQAIIVSLALLFGSGALLYGAFKPERKGSPR